MGRTFTPRYVVSLYVPGFYLTPACWYERPIGQIPACGRPNLANLERYVLAFEASTAPGGANEHLGPMRVQAAAIRRNEAGGATVAEWRRPAVAVPVYSAAVPCGQEGCDGDTGDAVDPEFYCNGGTPWNLHQAKV